MPDPFDNNVLEIGRSIGLGQAFGLVATKCSASQARCIQSIRDERRYVALGLTWEEFCRTHLGVSRAYADQLIRNLREFGEAYFQLSQILRISETGYREIAGSVSGEAIEINGEHIPIAPENAARLRAAVARLRADLDRARATPRTGIVISLQERLDSCFKEMAGLLRVSLDPGEQAALQSLTRYAREKLNHMPTPPEIPRPSRT
jgi:hypothetical protein